ncbi:MAG: glycine cleavage system aminomethyltransferase GcvT [Betaproteobacteria bacterium]|nr:glycine cleavage system aminomethyltransferase GcvT [Betaproteobacteria bacterium]
MTHPDESLKKTPLHPVHVSLGGRMVPFSGWDMPLHYGSQIEEHHAVRRACGIFDVSHMLAVDVEGSAALAFLRALLANDAARLDHAGRALYACMLRDDGGVLDDLICYRRGDACYRLVVNAGTAEADLAWLRAHAGISGEAPEIRARRDLAMIAVQGPTAQATLATAIPAARELLAGLRPFHAAALAELFIARTGYTGEDGFEILLPAERAVALWNDLQSAGARPCGLGARDTLRLEAGMNLYGQDMDQSVSPLESGLAWTVDLSGERAFIGRDALTAIASPRAFLGLLLLDPGVLRAHQAVRTRHGEGVVTSGGFSPTLQRSIALARLPAGSVAGEEVTVDIRGRSLRARVVKPPFVRHGHAMVEL